MNDIGDACSLQNGCNPAGRRRPQVNGFRYASSVPGVAGHRVPTTDVNLPAFAP